MRDSVSKVASALRQQDNNICINKGVHNSAHFYHLNSHNMKFVLLFAFVLFCQVAEPCEAGKLFDFFHNFLAHRAATIVNRFVRGEKERESFRSFFRDIIEARLFANGRIGWNETFTVPPSTTPQITTPLSELNYWKNVSFLFEFFLLIFRLLVKFFFGKCFFVL